MHLQQNTLQPNSGSLQLFERSAMYIPMQTQNYRWVEEPCIIKCNVLKLVRYTHHKEFTLFTKWVELHLALKDISLRIFSNKKLLKVLAANAVIYHQTQPLSNLRGLNPFFIVPNTLEALLSCPHAQQPTKLVKFLQPKQQRHGHITSREHIVPCVVPFWQASKVYGVWLP